jgi:hypothetical protein
MLLPLILTVERLIPVSHLIEATNIDNYFRINEIKKLMTIGFISHYYFIDNVEITFKWSYFAESKDLSECKLLNHISVRDSVNECLENYSNLKIVLSCSIIQK